MTGGAAYEAAPLLRVGKSLAIIECDCTGKIIRANENLATHSMKEPVRGTSGGIHEPKCTDERRAGVMARPQTMPRMATHSEEKY